jgi:hypothetical protein
MGLWLALVEDPVKPILVVSMPTLPHLFARPFKAEQGTARFKLYLRVRSASTVGRDRRCVALGAHGAGRTHRTRGTHRALGSVA